MSVVPKFFGLGMKFITIGSVDLDSDTFKFGLHTASWTPNQDTNDFYDDATNELATANGYAPQTLTSVAVTYDSASQQVRWDMADFAFTFTAAQTWRYGQIHKSRGGAASADELVCYLDWGSNQTVSTPYTLVIDPAGLLYIDVT